MDNSLKWEPIATAPRDGTEVLLGYEDSGDIDFYRYVSSLDAVPEWQNWADRCSDPPHAAPTHWMLIDPPHFEWQSTETILKDGSVIEVDAPPHGIRPARYDENKPYAGVWSFTDGKGQLLVPVTPKRWRRIKGQSS